MAINNQPFIKNKTVIIGYDQFGQINTKFSTKDFETTKNSITKLSRNKSVLFLGVIAVNGDSFFIGRHKSGETKTYDLLDIADFGSDSLTKEFACVKHDEIHQLWWNLVQQNWELAVKLKQKFGMNGDDSIYEMELTDLFWDNDSDMSNKFSEDCLALLYEENTPQNLFLKEMEMFGDRWEEFIQFIQDVLNIFEPEID